MRARFRIDPMQPRTWHSTASQWDAHEVLQRLHPSVVLDRTGRASGYLAGFRVLAVSEDGTTDTVVGFGKDPIFGWPGDYMLGLVAEEQ